MKRNMKRVLLVLCMVTVLFSLSACSSMEESDSQVDPAIAASLQQQTVDLLKEITEIPINEMGMLIAQNRMNGAEAVAVGLESYVSLADELGAFISVGEGTVTQTEEEFNISVDAVFENRKAAVQIGLSKDMFTIMSMSFNPEYSTKENMIKAGMNTAMGMGTVFAVLIFISLIIGCFKYINAWELNRNKNGSGERVPSPAEASIPEIEADLTDDLELAAVITAAIAASEGTSADGLVVRSIKRVPVSKWKKS